MRRAIQAGGPLTNHLQQLYLNDQPPPGTSLGSMMWDELLVASLVDPSVIKKSEIMYLDVDIDHGPKYGHTVVRKKPDDFLASSGPQAPDRDKWLAHLAPPAQLHPASVQVEVGVKRFEDIFVALMSQSGKARYAARNYEFLRLKRQSA